MRSKYLPLYLPKEVYDQLEHAARVEDRDPIQQARYLLRQALGGNLQHTCTVADAERHGRARVPHVTD